VKLNLLSVYLRDMLAKPTVISSRAPDDGKCAFCDRPAIYLIEWPDTRVASPFCIEHYVAEVAGLEVMYK
jgi:hypothetical protein